MSQIKSKHYLFMLKNQNRSCPDVTGTKTTYEYKNVTLQIIIQVKWDSQLISNATLKTFYTLFIFSIKKYFYIKILSSHQKTRLST